MADVSVLNIRLHGEHIGVLTHVGHDRSLFSFTESYIENASKPTLGLRFKDAFGELITEFKPTQAALMPYFSNLLPEGHLREYLSERAGVNSEREFYLLWALGMDLPGAMTVTPDKDEAWSSDWGEGTGENNGDEGNGPGGTLRFSLAGVQLKFSAISGASGGLTIPAKGIGGSWIVKLPSARFAGVPENEYSMMELARLVGMDIPSINLIDVKDVGNLPAGIGEIQGQAFVIKRFDRLENGNPVHIEDFAQVFDVYPRDKYKKASAANIAQVIGAESDEKDISEFIRRLVFNVLISNADMHLKNWSLIYPDKRSAKLSPAYDFVSTVAYIEDKKAALKFSRTKRFDEFTFDELKHLASRALLPEKTVLDIAMETVALFHEHWQKEKLNLPLYPNVIEAIDKHLDQVPMATKS